MIRKQSARLFIVSVVLLAVLSVSAVMPNWTNGFLIKEGITATYSSPGVEVALQKLDSRAVDFAAVDAPLSAEQVATCNDCAQIPWLLTGVDVAYRLKGVNKLNLSGPVVAAIFNGKVSRWNDPEIAALNPKAKLPGTGISVVYPSEASGQSWTFTSYLEKVAGKKSGGVSVAHFEAGTTAAGDRGVGAAVNSTNGSIGYVSASVKTVPASGLLDITDPAASAAKAYPLATFGYAVIPHAAPQKGFVEQFLNYAVGPGGALGAAVEIAPLPKTVRSAARSAIGAL